MFKKTPASQDTVDWMTTLPASQTDAFADNVYQAAAGCVISAGILLTGNIEATDIVLLEGRMVGDISSTGPVRVVGKLQGNVKANSLTLDKGEITGNVETVGLLTVEPGSTLAGNVCAESAHINGTIRGNLNVSGRVVLCSSTVLEGDLTAGSVVMEAGAVINGHFKVG